MPERAHAQAVELTNRLAKLVEESEPAQAAVAADLGWSRSHLSNVLRYRQPLKVSELFALCDRLGIGPTDLISQKVAPARQATASFQGELEEFIQAAARAGYNEEILRRIMDLVTQLGRKDAR